MVIGLDEVVHQSECPNLVAQEENANLDFAGKFVQPTSTSFTIPISDLLFKNKRCQLDRDEDEGNKNGGINLFLLIFSIPAFKKTVGISNISVTGPLHDIPSVLTLIRIRKY